MSFVDMEKAQVLMQLRDAHYAFPRAAKLREGFEWILSDYWSKAALEAPFEARGLLVTGPSRTGKTVEIAHQLSQLNDGSTRMPDDRPVRIASVMLSGTMSWKDLGMKTLLDGLRMESRGKMTQRKIWNMVSFQARAQGVHGIHYDECQHIFPRSADARKMLLDSFKTLLKNPEWPLMLVLSGVDELVEYVNEEEQLAWLLRPVVFNEIVLASHADQHELNCLCYAYSEHVELDFANLSSLDFFRRLSIACANRWGLVIELLIDACVEAKTRGQIALSKDNFCRALTKKTCLPSGYSPFSIEDYERLFKGEKMFDLWEKQRSLMHTN
ncbi:MAG: TniB family NTP-binding protein [Pseudomonadota bacterium]